MITASAPGKIILFGEHAVVYGQPALAAPVTQVQAAAAIEPGGDDIWIDARDLRRRYRLAEAAPNDPLATAIHLVLRRAAPPHVSPFTLRVTSTIPIASGLGSGAAVCTAAVRALAAYLGLALSAAEVSALVFETEKLLHGTPSGIDNTVIAYGQPVWFIKDQPPEPFSIQQPFHLLIADTGLPSPTKITVGDVRAAWQTEPARYEKMFSAVGDIVRQARMFIETGQPERLGLLMNRNHVLLCEMGVSCDELDILVEKALDAGALGAKLSGGGRGGNLIALVTRETRDQVCAALEMAGAKSVINTVVA